MSATEVLPEVVKANLSLKAIGRGNDAISEIPLDTYFYVFGPAVVILILCIVLFEKDETVTKNQILWLQAIDVLMVAVLVYGLMLMLAALGRFVMVHNK